nr:DoxX family protein [Saprospiraceae bacterium]
MSAIVHFLNKRPSEMGYNITLLIARIGFGGMMLPHGWPKLTNYAERSSTFADPLGIGSELSLISAVFAEVFCAVLLILGLGSRLVLIPLMFTMFVAGVIHHADDPFSSREKALLYLVAYFLLFITGPGKYSLDSLLWGKRKKA